MRVLISGAGGFVGGQCAAALARNGHDVVGLVRRAWPIELGQQIGVRLERVDLAQTDHFPAGPFDALLHCAAALPSAVPDEIQLARINIEGSRRLFEHALRNGVTTIIFCSSMAAYGRIESDVVDPDTPVQNPNVYGRSKRACEDLLQQLSQANSMLHALSIRLPGVVGPGSHHNFLSDAIAGLFDGAPVAARNPDALFNNVVHVDDLAAFAEHLLISLPPGHRVTTIAGSDPLPIREVLAILEAAAELIGVVRYEQSGHSFLISNEHARTLGYRPATVRDSVERYAASYGLTGLLPRRGRLSAVETMS